MGVIETEEKIRRVSFVYADGWTARGGAREGKEARETHTLASPVTLSQPWPLRVLQLVAEEEDLLTMALVRARVVGWAGRMSASGR